MQIPVTRLNQEEILRYLGYRGTGLTEQIQELVRQSVEKTLAAIRPQGIFKRLPIHRGKEGIFVSETGLCLTGSSIAEHLADSDEIWLMAVTIGQGMDRLIRTSMLQKPEEGVILDSCGAAAVESAADWLNEQLRGLTEAEGLFLTTRFSPGYGDLPIDIQQKFLNVLDAPKQIGLTATASSLLAPSKSVTAVIGLLKTPVQRVQNPCDACKLRSICELRKAGQPCWKRQTESSC